MRTRNCYYYHVNRREAHKYLVWSQEMYKYINRHNGFQTGVTKDYIEWEPFYCGLLTQDTPHDKPFKWTYELPIEIITNLITNYANKRKGRQMLAIDDGH